MPRSGLPSGFRIRRAGAADADALAELGTATFVETFGHLYSAEDLVAFLAQAHSSSRYAGLLGDPDVAIWLAFGRRSPPVGYVVAGPCKLPSAGLEATAGEIRQLYLRATAQGQGLGSRLLVTAMEWLTARGRRPLYIGVWSRNLGAQRLYGRFGFEKVGEYDFPVGQHLDREFILKRRDPT